jgi:hypothetical protein
MHEPYWLAADCPNCGQKDELEQFKGARLFNSEWGHSYSCCSEACGRAFLNSPQHKAKERERIKREIKQLRAELEELSDG